MADFFSETEGSMTEASKLEIWLK